MSAYLCFANARRGAVKAQNPDCSNGEISRLLAEMWKNTPDEIKRPFKEEEQAKWEAYKQGMKDWRKAHDKRKKSQLKRLTEVNTPFDGQAGSSREKKKQSKTSDVDFGPIDGESGFDDHLGLQGIDQHGNPNPDEIMAASALRGVRGGPQYMGMGMDTGQNTHPQGNYGTWFNNMTGSTSGMNGVNPNVGPTMGTTPASSGFNQMDVPHFAYNQYGNYATIGAGNSQAAIMAQLRGAANPYHQQYPASFLSKCESWPL
jgi:HMG (high mobility group) box